MNEPRYTTTTTVVETTEYMSPSDSPTYAVTGPNVDFSYVRTLGGIMKCVCIALCLLCFLCVLIGGPGYYSGAGWATFVSSVGLCVSTTLLFLYLFRVVDALPQVPWIVGSNPVLIPFMPESSSESKDVVDELRNIFVYCNSLFVQEMCFCFAWTIFFFIAACVLAVAAARFTATGGWAVAAFFAFGAMCAYGFDCYLKFLSWKNNEVATGGGGRDFIAEQRRRAQRV